MSVTLNEAALRFILEDRAGPVGLMLKRTLDVVAGNEEAIINLIFARNPTIAPGVKDEIVDNEDGMVGVVSLVPDGSGSVAQYLADKMDREDWIVPAIFQNWDSQI